MDNATHLGADDLAKFSTGERLTPTLTVETPGGQIAAELSRDPDFPGVHILVGGEVAAIVEYSVPDGGFIVRAYARNDDEPRVNMDYAGGADRGG